MQPDLTPRIHALFMWGTLVLLMLIGTLALPPAAAQATQTRTYDIPAGPLSTVLSRFAAESDLLLSADAAHTEGRQSEGLRGEYTARQALEALLAGTGLAYRFTDARTVTIQPPAGGYLLDTLDTIADCRYRSASCGSTVRHSPARSLSGFAAPWRQTTV